jgi:hypothetical protein
MYRVGFIDNSFDLLPDYQKRLQRHDIELFFPENGKSKEEIIKWIIENNIRCLLIDHKLLPDYEYVGTDLLAYVNGVLPDLPCMILTAYTSDSLEENLVTENMIISRDCLDASSLASFCEKLKQAADVFSKRLDLHEIEYRDLLKAKQEGIITSQQEERLEYLYKLLKSYGEIDEIPAEMLKPEVENKVNSLIDKLNLLISKEP